VPAFHEFAGEVGSLVGSNGAANAEDDGFHEMRTSLRLW
jgi:hypothetical protein